MAAKFVAAIDHGTTSTRCMLFDAQGRPVATAQRAQTMHYPQPGWVELDMGEVWQRTQECIHEALGSAGASSADVAGIGITNERETRRPVGSTDGTPGCAVDHLAGHTHRRRGRRARGRRGHPSVPAAHRPADLDVLVCPEACVAARPRPGQAGGGQPWGPAVRHAGHAGSSGTSPGGPDGGVHVTDPTNASRTLLMNLHTLEWDEELLDLMEIPRPLLPEIRSSSEVYGMAVGDLSGVPVAGVLGDQQASLFGHTCFDHGDMKNTYGTGAFLLFTLGNEPVMSEHGLITTVAWKLGDADPVYALEGSVAIAGALVQWLRDNLGIIDDAGEVEALARSVDGSEGVVFVPAFSGLFAPYWRDDARGVIVGLTRFCQQGTHCAGSAGGHRLPDVRPGAGHARRHRTRAARGVARRRGHDP